MNMRRTIMSFLLTVVAMLVLLNLSMHWWSPACFPFEVHTPKWQCNLGAPLVALSFATPGAIYGATIARSPWLEGIAAAIVSAGLAGAMSYFHPLFSGINITNALATLFYAVLPGLLGVLAGFRLRPFMQRNAA